MRRLLIVVVLGAVLGAASMKGDWRAWLERAPGRPADGAIVLSGYVEARQHRVSCKAGGILESLRFEEGEAVEAGQVLAQLDTTDARLALGLARAERARADAELRLGLAGFRAEDIAQARAQVKRAESDLAGAERELVRMSRLLSTGSGTTKSHDDALVRRDSAAWTRKGLLEQLQKLEAGNRPEEIDAAKARLGVADARIAQLEQQLKDATVTCPVAGLVTEKLAEQGELASRGTAVAAVTDLTHPWLNVYVAEPELDRIRLGQEATVLTDGGRQRSGRLTFIASQAEFTPKNVQTLDERVKLVYKVKIALENADGLFKPGMPAEARLRPVAGGKP